MIYLRSLRLCGKKPRFLVTNKLTLDRFCEDWRIKLMCTSGPCPRSALEESSNGIGGHGPYRGHGPLVHNPCPGQWFYPSLFGSGSSGLGCFCCNQPVPFFPLSPRCFFTLDLRLRACCRGVFPLLSFTPYANVPIQLHSRLSCGHRQTASSAGRDS